MKKLYRSTTQRVISGVCAGIGEYLNIDPVIIRIVFVVLVLATGIFPFIIGYIVAALLIPERSHDNVVDEQ